MRRTGPVIAPLILGAGPAGCAAAIVLARAGLVPLLLDRDAQVRDPLCGGFLSWRTAKQLRALGLDPTALGARRVAHAALFAGRLETIVPLPGESFALSRGALDSALRARAVSLGARLEIDSIRALEGNTAVGRRQSWAGAGLFLATGKHDARGLPRPRHARDPALGLRLRLPASPASERLLRGRIELHLFGGGYAGIVLQEDGSTNVCLALRKSLLARHGGTPASLLAGLAERHPAFALRLGDGWRELAVETIGSVPYGWFARSTLPGLFRLGDQAAVIPSLAGEGIGIALASGTLAAHTWLARGAGGASGYQARFAALVQRPMAAARAARGLAESPAGAWFGLKLARAWPSLVRALMDASRIEAAGSLAQPPAAP